MLENNTEKTKEKIEQTIKNLLEHLSVPAPKIEVNLQENTWTIAIQSQDDRPMVGQDGENFEHFSHLLKRMLAKNIGEDFKINIDVNNRNGRNIETLKTKAVILAERARSFKKDIELDPMSSFERMVIHTALEGSPHIKTESVGEGKNRHLVVRYVPTEKEEKLI
jgi:spoIIIJ-associated protein